MSLETQQAALSFRARMSMGTVSLTTGARRDLRRLRFRFRLPHRADRLGALRGTGNYRIPIKLWLAGVAFGLALVAASCVCARRSPRQLLIMPFVLAGWFPQAINLP